MIKTQGDFLLSVKNKILKPLMKTLHLSYIWKICINNRYIIASTILLAIMILHSLYGQWVDDFWEHSAVVRELSTHPLHPQHPLFNVTNSHPFFSPYLLLVGLLSRYVSLTPVDALMITGIFNLAFLLVSLRLFINNFFKKHHDAISFYSLILILFMWSAYAWDWSGFIHFKILGFILPYPATFSIATTFLIFTLYYRTLESFNLVKYIISIILTAIIILSHPTTSVFAILGIISISLHHYKILGLKAVAKGILLLIMAFLLATLWPYFSIIDLVIHNNMEFNATSDTFYTNISLIWPTLILAPFALPVIISRYKNNRFDAIVLLICLAIFVYIFGYITGQYGVGRIISLIAIFIQINIAVQLARLENTKTIGKSWSALPVVFYVLVIISSSHINRTVLSRAYMGLRGINYNYYDYNILKNNVKQYDVILSDLGTSWMIPTFGGKIIASKHPAHWLDDHQKRRDDINRFFSKDVLHSEKIMIIDNYQVDYIFINRNIVKDFQLYFGFGDIISDDKDHLLIKIHKNN